MVTDRGDNDQSQSCLYSGPGGEPQALVWGCAELESTGNGVAESGAGSGRIRGRRVSGRDNYFDKRRTPNCWGGEESILLLTFRAGFITSLGIT